MGREERALAHFRMPSQNFCRSFDIYMYTSWTRLAVPDKSTISHSSPLAASSTHTDVVMVVYFAAVARCASACQAWLDSPPKHMPATPPAPPRSTNRYPRSTPLNCRASYGSNRCAHLHGRTLTLDYTAFSGLLIVLPPHHPNKNIAPVRTRHSDLPLSSHRSLHPDLTARSFVICTHAPSQDVAVVAGDTG
jgi:hypothetical protein